MIEIYPNLFVGPKGDYEQTVRHENGWYVVHAAKELYHRQAVGYVGPDAPTDHPEYLFARRGARLMLNLIDAPVQVDIPRRIFDVALEFIDGGLRSGHRLLVHCIEGRSRSASVGLLYLASRTPVFDGCSHREAEERFNEIYAPLHAGVALRRFVCSHWQEYRRAPRK